MIKTKSLFKYFKNINNSINSLLERNLNKLNFKNLNYLFKNNKLILIFVAVFVLFVSYLLIPTFYKQSNISKELKTELQNKFNLNFRFSSNLKYNIFPKPHFTIVDSNIFDGKSEISKVNNLKIFVSLNNFFSLSDIEIRDLIIDDAKFYLNKKNYNFFINLLNKNFEDSNLIIKNSNIFFRNSKDEVLFINKIIKTKYYYEKKELKNILFSENEIFNIPFSIETFFNTDKSKNFSEINLNLIKLKIYNELSLDRETKIGKSEFFFNKVKRIANYQIEKNSFNFHIFDKIEQPSLTYKGEFNFNPFYATLKGDLEELNLNSVFGSNALIVQLLKTEILNNKNIDFLLNINADKITKNYDFRNIHFKSKIQDGLIDVDKSKFEWKNLADFELLQSLIFVKDGELVIDGKLKINIKNYKDIYKFLLTPRNYRNEINQIDLNFTYNFDQNIAELKDIVIDNKINQKVNKTLNNIIIKKNNIQNKIYFKNLLNEAIKNYAG